MDKPKIHVEMSAVQRIDLAHDALAGRVAVVTGAGRGIGRETACTLARLGARVAIAERSDMGAETEQRIRAAGGEAIYVNTDVSDAESVTNLARVVTQVLGPVDILINNAIICPAVSVVDMDVSLWDRVIAVNLRGAFLMCKAFLPGMLARHGGVVVNMVSTDAMPCLAAYIASKQGLAGFSQSLAAEVGPQGVRVIAFGPGMVDTPGIRGVAQGLASHLGMSADQFLGMSLHPAYEGLMPAEHAAAATAYLIVRLADEYHGEVVDAYTVLERAGLIRSAPPLETTAVRAADTTSPVDLPPAQRQEMRAEMRAEMQVEMLAHVVEAGKQLQAVVEQIAAEFDRLPVFVRPLARSGFKSKAGQSIQEWGRTAAMLTDQLNHIAAPDGTALPTLRADFPRLQALSEKLVDYLEGVPAETARFTKDATMLRQVSQLVAERKAVVRAAIQSIQTVLAST
ncbi:MAG: SDR family oxidoreductase [Chloroflexi bacterium]|nr:SDR family oxidoreductase [Chloroflexota bacterium]